jgi:SpoIID/LytB domain protein
MNRSADKEQRAKGKNEEGEPRVPSLRSLPFALCLLPFALLVGLLAWTLPGSTAVRTEAPERARVSDDEADEALRRAAQSALGVREGAVVVLDVQTGRVRALAGGRTAFEEATPPGSAIKPFTMLAALRSGTLAEDTRVFCRGHYQHEDFKINCSHPRYRTAFGPAQALANSCNYFFARVAESLDGETYARMLREFGFGVQTRAGDEQEATGLLPRGSPHVPEMLGESEQLRVTPAQLVTAYAALFNGGRLLAPQVARAEGFAPRIRAHMDVAPAHRAMLVAGMRGVVAYGTAARAGLATLPVYVFGKTGTSTPQDDWRAQGWFVGFAAGENPPTGKASAGGEDLTTTGIRLAVLVFLKRSHGAEAAELARPVFEAYARTLARQQDSQLAGRSSDEDAEGARLSNSGDGPVVRVRLTREDSTVSLPLEEYVFGVLAAEGSVETEPEALKALAVVARTYALKNLRRHARDRFDLCDTTHCQRFAPVRDEGARPEFYELAHRAVRETAGEVLHDASGHVAESYFSAACGGRTADIAKLWGVARAPAHLRGVRDDFCAGTNEAWTDVIPATQLLRALRADERSDVGARLDGVRVVRRDQTGRAELVGLEGARRRTLRGWDFKIIVGRTLGWSVLKSSRFEVARAGSAYVFRGTGFGHGLGLCQAGAHISAGRGGSYRQILKQYFPGTSIGKTAELHASDSVSSLDSVSPLASAFNEIRSAGFQTSISQTSIFQTPISQTATLQTATFQTATFRPAVYDTQHVNDDAMTVNDDATRELKSSVINLQSANRGRLASEHFRVSYPARAERREVEALMQTLEAAYRDVSRRLERASLGASLPDMDVFVYATTGDFVGATGQPAWVAAVTEGKRIELQPLEVLRRRRVLSTTPRHEFVHAALEAVGSGRAPRWLVEGLAAYVAGEGAALAGSTPKERISTDELERRLALPGSPQEMRSLYAAAYAEVFALVRREGEAAVWRHAAR